MRKLLLLSIALLPVTVLPVAFGHAQYPQKLKGDSIRLTLVGQSNLDSLEQVVRSKKDDTAKANLLGTISWVYSFNQAEKGLYYGRLGLELSERLAYPQGIAYCTNTIAMNMWLLGNYSNALQQALKALHFYEQMKFAEGTSWAYYVLANVYRDFGDYKRAMYAAQKYTSISESLNISPEVGYAIIGSIYELQNNLDSALYFEQKAHQMDVRDNKGSYGWIYYVLGNIYRKQGQYDTALTYYRKALPLLDRKDIIETYNSIATLYKDKGQPDSSIFYANEVLHKWSNVSYERGTLQAVTLLSQIYKSTNQRDSLIKYLELSIALGNQLYNQENERSIQNLSFNEDLRQDEMARQRQQYVNQLKLDGLVFIGALSFAIALLLWRNNQRKQRDFSKLQQQEQETERQKTKVEKALTELKAAQAQLIQSEKMASLGEISAGIAHEIKNPLNFINNFSEINQELLAELKQEIQNGNIEEALQISGDAEANQQKISQHGKRADAIVKGLLYHSRKSTGQKEPTNVNALTEEFLQLAFYGYKAKDKAFTAQLETRFDEHMDYINAVPQDLSRVLLNLFDNAFYSVQQKKERLNGSYEPKVVVSTKRTDNKALITVWDNGTGMPKNLKDKIFQPFFSTKPAGKGTGLGLSLSYEIIKAHEGSISVDTKEGEYTEFVIELPV